MQSSVIDIGSDTGDVYPIDFRIRTRVYCSLPNIVFGTGLHTNSLRAANRLLHGNA